jgi:hypothetical protein
MDEPKGRGWGVAERERRGKEAVVEEGSTCSSGFSM